ncbi:Eco57I restriction-modification methylase domain-containing protein [Kocuria rhizophila]|uniref:Eco57I restriction-modification methylase domain-containing protein n=1 Tax=Kocuria rhizophila TaxID=72000 RepID=UPI0021A45C3C|nr:Eco57I restriction-modification methylase domain-containing protein [Kocuria rhizophila]MCT1544950.1 Eco57I restriction-modification methylase domain-containing protein [Kocuria rhizophila]MCT2171155.1 Eco57I restriction-modification methylase domain-containing protein [Kocuria rhizophila]
MTLAPFTLRGHNPDVLTCIANLSNDEVFTPPEFANQMLDTLTAAWADANDGADIWANPDVTFLDPFTKSGVFLREIVRRLTDGLILTIPDLAKRVDHILTHQVFGIGITQLTALLARRSVYCSKIANGSHSIAKSITTEDGNIWFERTEHTWGGGKREFRSDPLTGEEVIVYANRKCIYCGAGEDDYARGDDLETHAYAFIHTDDIKARIAELFGDHMQFDVIIGNPPYQLSDGGYGTSAAPIYQMFVEKALGLDPRFAVFVTPSRWFAGGKGLDEYRKKMLSDHRMRDIVDYPKLYEAFPGVKIRGGVSYFLWDREHEGPCTVQTIWDGQPVGEKVARFLDAYDVLVRRNEAVPILEKVRAQQEPTLDARVSSQKPFGLRTFVHGKETDRGLKNPVKLYGSRRVSWIDRSEIPVNDAWIDDWKVLTTRVQGTSAAVETKFLSKPIVAGPDTACTESYLVTGRFDSEKEANRYALYLRTRFARFLISLRKSTQDAPRHVFAFVPDVPLDRDWTDALLYERYGLTADEVTFIESQVAPHDDTLFDEDGADDSDE